MKYFWIPFLFIFLSILVVLRGEKKEVYFQAEENSKLGEGLDDLDYLCEEFVSLEDHRRSLYPA